MLRISKDSIKQEILRIQLSDVGDDALDSARPSSKEDEALSRALQNRASIGSPRKKMNLRDFMTNLSPRKYALTAKGGRRSPGLEEYGNELYDTSYEEILANEELNERTEPQIALEKVDSPAN